jgi:hypothetical protein
MVNPVVNANLYNAPLAIEGLYYDSTLPGIVFVNAYSGNIALVGKESTGHYRVIFLAPCTSIVIASWPRMYLPIPAYLDIRELDYVAVIVPAGLTESQLLSYISTLAP